MRALIGHTGFVGSNLLHCGTYDACFNSTNSSNMRGAHFDVVVCAGVSAVKWKANKEPEADWAHISALMENIDQLSAGRFVLISTVDVYQKPIGVTESDPADKSGAAYGMHRARLEEFVSHKFSNHTIVRLPALYGRGLKKNAIYDLRHDNMVEAIDPRGTFQWYDVRRLESDLQAIVKSGIEVINVAAEPVSMSDIGDRYFPGKLRKPDLTKPGARYDMQTEYASILGGGGNYHFTADQVLDGIGNYLVEGC